MGHKREKPVRHAINDYVLMRVYGKKKFYFAQVKKTCLYLCKVHLETNDVRWTTETKQYNIPKEGEWASEDVAVKNFGLRKNINLTLLSEEQPELFLRLI